MDDNFYTNIKTEHDLLIHLNKYKNSPCDIFKLAFFNDQDFIKLAERYVYMKNILKRNMSTRMNIMAMNILNRKYIELLHIFHRLRNKTDIPKNINGNKSCFLSIFKTLCIFILVNFLSFSFIFFLRCILKYILMSFVLTRRNNVLRNLEYS
ncbi:hypothetical protein CWI36_0509p0020 [Hamiltosporidium magnivora]|uniref:Variable surface protein n=1 Tax=Hamiltosporidium magnivora TaxID=148818 RepID=A0A4Q9LF62_9MICR|nr:hypothetical protein CWI36_0509p0020 [Hamiltosporidium magnivora]